MIAGDYKFNSKWILGLEIEFESGGTGTAYELENTENGEYETEVEKGGEVAVEQFHITRLITPAFNVRAGHIYISGTASIDNKGDVLYLGDVGKQTLRMWENVEKLLEEGGATYDDVAQIVVYLRDVADYGLVEKMFREKFPDTPYVITLAPVCRPTWLIEMECIAITQENNTAYRKF